MRYFYLEKAGLWEPLPNDQSVRWHNTVNSPSAVEFRFTSAAADYHSKGVAMRTPAGFFAKIFPRALTFPSIPKQNLM